MNQNQPPKVAKWLLRHFGSSPNIEAIVGDLDERYSQGRSYLWYWREALQAIVTGFCQEVSGHKVLAIRALLLGWLVKFAWQRLSFPMFFWAACNENPNSCGVLFDWHSHWFMPLLLASVTASVALCIMSVWLVSRTSGQHYRSMVLLYVLVEVLAVPAMIFAGPKHAIVVVLFPGGSSMLWAAPFTTYFYVGLSKLGYPFETVISLWFGCILMALTMLMAGRIFNAPEPASQGQVM